MTNLKYKIISSKTMSLQLLENIQNDNWKFSSFLTMAFCFCIPHKQTIELQIEHSFETQYTLLKRRDDPYDWKKA